MKTVLRTVGGIEYIATEEEWKLFDNVGWKNNGCGVSLNRVAAMLPQFADTIEALEKFRKYGTKPLGYDFSVPCRLHDAAFVLAQGTLKAANDRFEWNLKQVRKGTILQGLRGFLASRWKWYARQNDSAIRRVIRLYRWLVDQVGKELWEGQLE